MKPRPHPAAFPHGALEEVLPGLYFVTGTVRMKQPVPASFSRAMTVVKEGERLVLVNSVRLNEEGLASLDRLGRVTDVIRLAAGHGSDDPFYKERYGAKVWAVHGSTYVPGFDADAEPYFVADEHFDGTGTLPITGAKVHVFASRPPEAMLVLPVHGGTVISGDALQNWSGPDGYFDWVGRLMMRMMGFLRPHNVGPGWLAQRKPPAADLRAVLDLPFVNVLPAHGVPVIGGARDKYRAAIEAAAKKRS